MTGKVNLKSNALSSKTPFSTAKSTVEINKDNSAKNVKDKGVENCKKIKSKKIENCVEKNGREKTTENNAKNDKNDIKIAENKAKREKDCKKSDKKAKKSKEKNQNILKIVKKENFMKIVNNKNSNGFIENVNVITKNGQKIEEFKNGQNSVTFIENSQKSEKLFENGQKSEKLFENGEKSEKLFKNEQKYIKNGVINSTKNNQNPPKNVQILKISKTPSKNSKDIFSKIEHFDKALNEKNNTIEKTPNPSCNGIKSINDFQIHQKSLPLFLESDCNNNNTLELKLEKKLELEDIIPYFTKGCQVIIKDDISQCFESPPPNRWNWNTYLFILWSIGLVVRYGILFPIRLIILILSSLIFFLSVLLTFCFTSKNSLRRKQINEQLIRFYSGALILTWTSVIKHNGKVPSHRPNQIYIANHTSMIDYIILLQTVPFAVIGQKHKGWVGWFQANIIQNMIGGIWFERELPKDRQRTSKIIKKYIENPFYSRLLVFPEGTCVNTRYCIQFKRGAFDLGAEICPIAINYNDSFSDAFWNSRRKSFARHLFDLMTSWALVCEVNFLRPMRIRANESAEEFAARVKSEICKAANITSKDWNGYLKHYRPSPKFREFNQKSFSGLIR